MRRRLALIWCGRLLAGAAILAILAGISVQLMLFRSGSRLDSELARARELGIPVEVNDLRRIAWADPAENAEPFYSHAIASLRSRRGHLPPEFDDALSLYSKLQPAKRRAILSRGIDVLEPALRSIERGSKMPRLDWRRKWELGFDLPLPEYKDLRDLAKILCARAERSYLSNRQDSALADVTTCLKLTEHLWMEPTSQAHAAGFTIEGRALQILTEMMSRTSLNRLQLTRIRELMEQRSLLPKIRDALGSELVNVRLLINTPSQREDLEWSPACHFAPSGPTQPPTDPMYWAVRNAAFRRAWEARTVRTAIMIQESSPRGEWTVREAMKTSQALEDAVWSDGSLENYVSVQYFPRSSVYPHTAATLLARRRILAQAAALLLERGRGELPESLPIGGTARIDPFTGESLGYRKSGNEFRVYSVGADLIDQQGITQEEAGKLRGSRLTPDLSYVFRLRD